MFTNQAESENNPVLEINSLDWRMKIPGKWRWKVRVKTSLRAGISAETATLSGKPALQGTQYTKYAQSVLDGVISSLNSEVSNLRVWSILRMKGDGFSDWMIISQRPKA
jgi:hypothetical protein